MTALACSFNEGLNIRSSTNRIKEMHKIKMIASCCTAQLIDRIKIKCDLIHHSVSVYGIPVHQEILLSSGRTSVLFILPGKNNYTSHAYSHAHSLPGKGWFSTVHLLGSWKNSCSFSTSSTVPVGGSRNRISPPQKHPTTICMRRKKVPNM